MLIIAQLNNLLAPVVAPAPALTLAGGGGPRRTGNSSGIDRFLASEFYKSRSRESLIVMLQTGDISEDEFLLFMQILE